MWGSPRRALSSSPMISNIHIHGAGPPHFPQKFLASRTTTPRTYQPACTTRSMLRTSRNPLRPCSKRVSTKFLRSGSRHRPRVRAYRAFHEATTDIRRRFATPQYRYYLFRMWSHIIVGLRRRPSQRSPPGSAPAIVGAQARSRATCSRRGQRYCP